MRFVNVLFVLLAFTSYVMSQCTDCATLNQNGGFSDFTLLADGSNDSSISRGMINNWYGTHGTGEHFDNDWNWYGIETIEDTVAHLCYGSRNGHDHSEGIYTELQINDEDDLTYCLSFDYSSHCASEKFGKVHIYLANNLKPGGPNGFKYPTAQTHADWFENSQAVEVLTLDFQTEYTEYGMTRHSVSFKPKGSFTQLWFFTEFLYEDAGYQNCGFLIDNVNVSATTSALKDIEAEETNDNRVELNAAFSKDLQGVDYEWIVDGNEYNEPTPTVRLDEGLHPVTLNITDDRGSCATMTKNVKVGNVNTKEICDYNICLDTGGSPSISSVGLVLPDGVHNTLDKTTPGFSFPYCISAPNVCSSGEYELEFLVQDLNNWLGENGLAGEVRIGGDNTLEDGCRAHMIEVIQSEVGFDQVVIQDQRLSDRKMDLYFGSDNCELYDDNGNLTDEGDTTGGIVLRAYPNPAIDELNVELSQELQEEDVTMTLLDSDGNVQETKVIRITSHGQTELIAMTNYDPGVYTLKVSGNEISESIKVVKL